MELSTYDLKSQDDETTEQVPRSLSTEKTEAGEKSPTSSPNADASSVETSIYLSGWRLHLVTFALCLSILLANFETGIVSTSLVSITKDLQGFSKASWIVTAYLFSFTSFLIIWAKLSDIFGRKTCITVSVFIFTVFSGGCGAAQTMTQLIICRVFQGLGGSGAYAITIVIIFELVPEVKYAAYTSLITTIFAFSLVLGPLVGSGINDSTTWRWIFLLNVPAGAVTIALLLFSLPNNFPHHNQQSYQSRTFLQKFSKDTLRRLDLIGAASLLSATLLIIVALQIGGIQYSWSSALIIIFIILSVFFYGVFIFWECSLRREGTKQEPVFPPRFFKNRVWLALLLNTFLVGLPLTTAIIVIPLRTQVVYGISPLGAGIRLIPFVFTSPFAATISSMLASKLQVPPIFLLLVGTAFQITGFSLLSTLPTSGKFFSGQYGYQVLAALGTGTNVTSTLLMTPFVTDKRDKSVAMGAVTQFRFLGGVFGLALVTAISNSWVKPQLSHILTPQQLSSLLQSTSIILTFPSDIRAIVTETLARGYNLQMRVLIGFCVAQIFATILMWQKKPLRIA